MRPVDLLVIHCSATPNGRWVSTLDINHWHAERGFRRQGAFLARQNPALGAIGYHFVIYTNGAIATGRHLDEVGAHVKGHNARSVGVCLIGTDRYSRAQWAAAAALIERLIKTYPAARVTGHRDLSPDREGDGTVEPQEWLKTCPGFDVVAWRRADMLAPAAHLLEEPA